MSVVIETTIGDITVDLFLDERPIVCLNFLKLCKLKYYNYNLFHTVEQGFIAQTGDPTGAGDQGCSIWGLIEGPTKRFFEAENIPKIFHTSAGLLSMVGAGKQMVGSQFFFTLADSLTSLDGNHCVIGEVVEGHEVLRKLNEAIVDEKFRPFQDIRITHTVVLDDPYPDPRGFRVPSRSPSPTAARLKNGRIAADEDIDDTDGKSMAEIQEMLAEREAKARATILEIVGDLPDADMAPPENVLFVCKLNPVTSDDDLEIIFSRFGRVKSCEVIRDKKTGDSLQYAFVEFEEQKSCEAAYFKMDNVLIDDRRIHVDFSQSVAKVKWRGKGRGVEGAEGRINFNNLRESGVNKGNKHEQHQQQQQRRNGHQNERLERMTSEERRRAREARHKEQEKYEKRNTHSRSNERERRNDKQRQKSRERTPIRRKQETMSTRDRNRDVRRSRERTERRRNERSVSRGRNERRMQYENKRYSRSRSRERMHKRRTTRSRSLENTKRRDYQTNRTEQRSSRYSRERRFSPNRQRQSRNSPATRRQNSPATRRRNSASPPQTQRRRNEDYREKVSVKTKQKLKEEPTNATKKIKRKKKCKSTSEESSSDSSSSSSSSGSSSDSSNDSTDTESEGSSSSSEVKRKKKSKKVKKSHKVKKIRK